MSSKALHDAFVEEASSRFAFLLNAGCTGPVMHRDERRTRLTYPAGAFEIHVGLYEREGVNTWIAPTGKTESGLPPLGRGLDCLYQTAGLGPANRITTAASSGHALRKAVDAQAAALEALLPVLCGPRFDELMDACAGR